jgi:glycosyltransferase involved in cell wall biosynthesis
MADIAGLRTALLQPRHAVRAALLGGAVGLRVDAFGPVIIIISAFWGRTGSTSIFDAQTRYFLERGCLICRIFVDHNPSHTRAQPQRAAAFLRQNFQALRPHLNTIVERDDGPAGEHALRRAPAFREASAIGRFMLALERPVGGDRALLAWARKHHALTLVNHAPHTAFARRHFSRAYILETHDVLTEQLTSHGVPRFARRAFDNAGKRAAEERAIWRDAQACINLSPADQNAIMPHARHARLIRPYAARKDTGGRAWAEVCAANALPAKFRSRDAFDIMLWGEWHETNVRGVRWFIDKVLPRDPRLASANILIAGRVTRGLPKSLLRQPHIFAAGYVDRLEDFFARAKVLVVPDLQGSGISIKTMEATAFGAPLVSTPAGLRGLDLTGIDMEGAANATALAREVAVLLDSDTARSKRAWRAQQIYERNFSEHAYETGWDDVLGKVRPDLMATFSRADACADDTEAAIIPLAVKFSANAAHRGVAP